MTKKQLLGFQDLFFILSGLACCQSIKVTIPVEHYEVASGGEVKFTCYFTPARPEISFIVLRWEVAPKEPGDAMEPVATYYYERPVDIAPPYEGRAVLTVDIAQRESSLLLTKVTSEDNRTYQCSVLIPDDDEGNTAASTSLMVLDPPSKPICSLQGTAEYWNNITLTCVSEKGMPKPTYEWRSYSVQNIQRPLPARATDKNGALSLVNISMETSGFYVCVSANRMGSASCNFTLAVMPHSMNIGSTAAIIGGVLAGVLCLGIIVYCCCKRNKKDKYVEGTPEAVEFHDVETVEGKEQVWDKSNQPTDALHDQATKQQERDDHYSNRGNREISQRKTEDDQHSYQGSRGQQEGRHGGSQDRLDDNRDRYHGSRDRLDDQRDRYGGSRDRLDDRRDRYGGSRDRLDDRRDRYGGSREHLEDHRDRYSGSRERLDDHRDRLEDHRGHYGGSRDRLDDRRGGHGGSRDRLDSYHGDNHYRN